MTVLTMRRVRDHFVVTGPDIEPVTFETRAQARDWTAVHQTNREMCDAWPL
jgi:hypothetical protein